MLTSPDRLQDPLALHLLLQAAQGLLEGLIFTNFNDWHVSMLLHLADGVKPPCAASYGNRCEHLPFLLGGQA